MSEITKKDMCCGCHACYNICPKNAITMIEDKKGFMYPVINHDKCINCGLCKKVCPILNNKKEDKKQIEAYACYNLNEYERMNSSSGGIFILIAKEIIGRGGVVFGASFDDNFNVIHSYVDSEEYVRKFMTSKYTQSSIGNIYKKVKEFLNDNRYVLFTGTPCQIEGLKSYLRKDYAKLYTQDIICHGVPSPKVWKKYVKYQEEKYNDKACKISFRNKDFGWTLYSTKIEFKRVTYSYIHSNDLFMKAFLSNICLRDSCYNCSFKKKYRVSDITLADYWGINNVHSDMNDDKGVSLIIVNSDKGRELFHSLKNNLKYVQTNLEDALKYNPAMIESANHSDNEKNFFDDIDCIDFDKLVKKYIPNTPLHVKIVNKIKYVIKKVFKI